MNHLQTVKNKFNQMADSQEDKGIQKYGQPLDPLDNYCWLEMAREEATDQYKYLVAEQEKRKFIANKIWNAVENCDDQTKIEVGHWLDMLEGRL